jgi:hypothetical protein
VGYRVLLIPQPAARSRCGPISLSRTSATKSSGEARCEAPGYGPRAYVPSSAAVMLYAPQIFRPISPVSYKKTDYARMVAPTSTAGQAQRAPVKTATQRQSSTHGTTVANVANERPRGDGPAICRYANVKPTNLVAELRNPGCRPMPADHLWVDGTSPPEGEGSVKLKIPLPHQQQGDCVCRIAAATQHHCESAGGSAGPFAESVRSSNGAASTAPQRPGRQAPAQE